MTLMEYLIFPYFCLLGLETISYIGLTNSGFKGQQNYNTKYKTTSTKLSHKTLHSCIIFMKHNKFTFPCYISRLNLIFCIFTGFLRATNFLYESYRII